MPNRRELGYVSAGSTSTVFVSTGIYGRATGGIGSPTAVTISGANYEYLTFNNTGLLTVTTAGWFDYCAVGGGSGIAHRTAHACGGGGAGQVLIGSLYLDANQTITIGGGSSIIGFVTGARFMQANDTTIAATAPFAVTALGSVQGLFSDVQLSYVGGGNGAQGANTNIAITGSTALGFRGGNSTADTNGGGGGGQSAIGGNGASTTGGTGGAGFDVSAFIGGSELRKAMGGGGGGSVTGGTAATGGVAGSATTTPPNGNVNSGGGGGGGNGVCTTGNGGSGICYIRWKTS